MVLLEDFKDSVKGVISRGLCGSGIGSLLRDFQAFCDRSLDDASEGTMSCSSKRLIPMLIQVPVVSMVKEAVPCGLQAKAAEVRNFNSAEVPEHMKPSKEQAIGIQWILT